MKKLKLFIRLFTLVCYFLPFVFWMSTCVGSEYRTAYNKKEAFENEAEANREKIKQLGLQVENYKNTLTSDYRASVMDSLKNEIKSQLISPFKSGNLLAELADSLNSGNAKEFVLLLIVPNNFSLSGIGAIFEYKHLYGKVIVAISSSLTLLTLLLWRFFKRKKIALPVLVLNFLLLSTLLADSFISNIDLLYGFWFVFILILAQILIEFSERKKRNRLIERF